MNIGKFEKVLNKIELKECDCNSPDSSGNCHDCQNTGLDMSDTNTRLTIELKDMIDDYKNNDEDFLKKLIKKHKLLKLVEGKTSIDSVKVIDLARELKMKPTELMEYILSNIDLFDLKILETRTKKHLTIKNVYGHAHENPNTLDYIEYQKGINEKKIYLSYYNNYGHISGVYIQPSSDKKSKYLNTPEKIDKLKKKYNLDKPASYILGGFGDCSTINPENGWELSEEVIEKMKKDGWEFIDSADYLSPEESSGS